MKYKIFLVAILALMSFGCSLFGTEKPEDNIIKNENSFEDSFSTQKINLTSPKDGQVLKSPFLIAGEADSGVDVVYVRVKNEKGDIVISSSTKTKNPSNSKNNPFGVYLNFEFQNTKKGFVEVYSINKQTKEEENLKSIPVSFDLSFAQGSDKE